MSFLSKRLFRRSYTNIDQHRSNVTDPIETRHIASEFIKILVHSAQIDGGRIRFAHLLEDFLVDVRDLASRAKFVFRSNWNAVKYIFTLNAGSG